MTRLVRTFAVVAALVAGLPALASQPGTLHVKDDAHLFTADGITKAKKMMADTTFGSTTHFSIVTFKEVPARKQVAFDAAKGNDAEREKFFKEWAKEEAKSHNERGVFVLICSGGGKQNKVEFLTDRQTDVSRDFTADNGKELANILKAGMKEGSDAAKNGKAEDEVKQLHDAALTRSVEFVIKELKNTSAPEPTRTSSTGTTRTDTNKSGGWSLGSMICIGLVAIAGLWLVFGLVRGLMGGGGGGGGMGGGGMGGGGMGGGGYGGGGGGGGFMSSMLGGMFGAAAGMYLYDSFRGSSHSNDAMAGGNNNNYDAGAGTTDTGAGDWDGGNAGGSDWDGDASTGNDAGGGGGGGDWGGDAGGGDTGGGGGDWGGGGGDTGGGGGGGGDGGGDW